MHPGTPAHGNQEQQSTPSILTILDWIIDNVLQHKQAARPQDRIDQVTPNSLAWLRSNPVSWWYHGLAERHKRAFGTLLLHIASETCKIGARDGCYIALTYMVRIVSLESAAGRELYGLSISTSSLARVLTVCALQHAASPLDYNRQPFPASPGDPHRYNTEWLPDHLFGRFRVALPDFEM
ncbi:hypothetical protein C6P46_002045 [Rhodotorula mucilaginosa]|uniref:Uncharacterized protein n=1 Tax=Rhodotorula mucilaginosa TaxID=5537 RepID=A0A9P6VU71_RHOMI|nr:hypothetical protein C6P46_002045 [Rhodotorula mucilaginosa]